MQYIVIKKGATNVSIDIYIKDETTLQPETAVVWNSAGIDLKYRRKGAVVVNITEATLSALTDAHSDGGFLAIGFGSYRLDVPDAAFATGADKVIIIGTVTGMIVEPVTIQLVDYDPEDAASLGLTTLTNQATATTKFIVVSGTLSLTECTTDLTESSDTHYVGRTIIWLSGANAEAQTRIEIYTGTNKKLTFSQVTDVPSPGDIGFIV